MNFYVNGYADNIFHSSEKINLVYTFTCNIKCAHCIVEGTPDNPEKMQLPKAKEIIQIAALNGKKMIVFTGGEIFLFFEELLELIECAKDYGFYIAVETNSYWATSEKRVRDLLSVLKRNGLNEIYTSADAFHMKYIPIENIAILKKVSQELGIVCEINFYKSDNKLLDNKILSFLGYNTDIPEYFTETLSMGGRDVSSYINNEDYMYPENLEENNSSFINFLPNGDVFYNVDTNKHNIQMKKSKLYLGNIYNTTVHDVFTSEKDSKVIQLIKSSCGTDIHLRFLQSTFLKSYYSKLYEHKRYLTLSDYYTDIFSDTNIINYVEKGLF